MSNLISIAVALTMMAFATGNLPRITFMMKLVQLQLIKDSQASKWGQPLLLPVMR